MVIFRVASAALISIHALREEGDFPAEISTINPAEFLSTPSARRATTPDGIARKCKDISIHALREEGDVKEPDKEPDNDIISIHALREEGDVIITSGYRTPA